MGQLLLKEDPAGPLDLPGLPEELLEQRIEHGQELSRNFVVHHSRASGSACYRKYSLVCASPAVAVDPRQVPP